MRRKELQNLIKERESGSVEFKASLSLTREIVESVSAFANTKGGKILVGITDSGRVMGVQIGKASIEQLTNKIAQSTEPKMQPKITVETIDKKKVIIIEVPENLDKLVLAFGRPFKRVGRSTVKMSKDEYERLILEKHKEKLQFDKLICKEANLADIDWEFIKKEFIPLYEKVSGKRITSNSKSILNSLGCIRHNRPTNAGVLLFGKDVQKFLMNAYIALVRYKGEEVDIKRLDYKEFTGNLFQQIDNCDKYIKDHISVMSRLRKDKVQREDIPEYGWFSIRELVTNSVCHRDYSNIGTKIIIRIFSNRIEFYNPGGLPKGITPKNITEMQFSRNPILSKILAKVKYIEELGEGWDKIIKEHKEHPLKPRLPTIKSDDYTFLVNVYSAKDKFMEEERTLELNERQKKIIEYLKSNKKVTTTVCAKLLNVSSDTALRDLTKLKSDDIIVRKGIGRGVCYILK